MLKIYSEEGLNLTPAVTALEMVDKRFVPGVATDSVYDLYAEVPTVNQESEYLVAALAVDYFLLLLFAKQDTPPLLHFNVGIHFARYFPPE